jgi:ribosomal protein S18 acetylase RimI-like enzyme
MSSYSITGVTPENAKEETLFCVKDITSAGFQHKQKWFATTFKEGLRLQILKNDAGKRLGFIEYVPARAAWRPIDADRYMFIHCLYVYARQDRDKGLGSSLLGVCEKEAKALKLDGLVTMTSEGSWISDKRLFEKNGFKEEDRRGRFELMVKKFKATAPTPQLIDWTLQQKKYKGWHLVYANQCPWHEKAVTVMKKVALDFNVKLKIKKLKNAAEARKAPSGFGVFSLLHNGQLLEDHYLSETRFRTILKKELSE